MYTKILLPLDGSPVAEQVLPYARFLAKSLDTPVELVHAIEPEIIATFADPNHGRYIDVVESTLKEEALRYLGETRASLPATSKVTCVTEFGKPADVIISRSAGDPGTLITMATHGRSGFQRWLLGSVAEKVLQMSANPLLLIRAGNETKTSTALRTIIAPLDGSLVAEQVLPHACELARRLDLEIVLVRVYAVPVMGFTAEDYYTPTASLDLILKQAEEEAKKYLEEMAARLKREGLKRVSIRFLAGESAYQIIDFARKTPDNLIAMCSHGKSGIGRLLLGSVAGRVVRHSGDPVLIVRAQAKA
jgi:nucleotide-binding universal stress UspA family protein